MCLSHIKTRHCYDFLSYFPHEFLMNLRNINIILVLFLTLFSQDVYVGDRNDEAHNKALSIISYIGCALSLVGLILTIITILIFK